MECKLHDTVCRSVSLFLGVAIVGIASILEANWPLRWWAHSPARSAAGEPATVTSPHGDRQVQNWFRTTGSLRSLFDEGRDTFLITPTPTAWRPSFSIFSPQQRRKQRGMSRTRASRHGPGLSSTDQNPLAPPAARTPQSVPSKPKPRDTKLWVLLPWLYQFLHPNCTPKWDMVFLFSFWNFILWSPSYWLYLEYP